MHVLRECTGACADLGGRAPAGPSPDDDLPEKGKSPDMTISMDGRSCRAAVAAFLYGTLAPALARAAELLCLERRDDLAPAQSAELIVAGARIEAIKSRLRNKLQARIAAHA